MDTNKGATPGAILSATPGAIPRQRPVNEGATYTPYTPSVAPALGGGVHADTDPLEVRQDHVRRLIAAGYDRAAAERIADDEMTELDGHLVPMPGFPIPGATGGRGHAFALCGLLPNDPDFTGSAQEQDHSENHEYRTKDESEEGGRPDHEAGPKCRPDSSCARVSGRCSNHVCGDLSGKHHHRKRQRQEQQATQQRPPAPRSPSSRCEKTGSENYNEGADKNEVAVAIFDKEGGKRRSQDRSESAENYPGQQFGNNSHVFFEPRSCESQGLAAHSLFNIASATILLACVAVHMGLLA